MAQGESGTVHKALGLLVTLGEFPEGATAAQVADRSGYPFSTAYRLLATLVSAGFATVSLDDKRYHLGLRIFQLGQRVAHHRGFEGTALPVMQRLTDVTGESSLLSVLDVDRHLTVHKVDGPQFRTTSDPGDRGLLHSTAIGKVLLAYSDASTRRPLLESIEFTAQTPHTITDPAAFSAQLDTIGRQGWAIQEEENDIGMAAVAVPVMSYSGKLLAALALASPIFRCDGAGLQAHLPELRKAASELASQLPLR